MKYRQKQNLDSQTRRFRWIMGAQFFWLLTVLVLGAWWGILILKYATRIAELEKLTGIAVHVVDEKWMRTLRMIYWEGATFFLLPVASTLVLFWLYWRDVKRSRSIQAFFASLTHELRTPLTSIRLQAESISEGQDNSALIRRLLEDTVRLEAQVERTLELARIEGGGPVYAQPLRLKPWLERIIQSVRESYGESLRVQPQLEDVVLSADSSCLQVILRNLFENSIRHSKRTCVQVSLAVKREAGGVCLDYQDNGVGFSGDSVVLGQLFQKGQDSSGAGVGLYLVKALMEKMGGRALFGSGTNSGFQASLWFREVRPDV